MLGILLLVLAWWALGRLGLLLLVAVPWLGLKEASGELTSLTMGSLGILLTLVVPILPCFLLISPRVVDVVHTPYLLVHRLPALVHSVWREGGR